MSDNSDLNLSKNDITESLISIQLEGYEVLEKDVKQSGNSGRIYLPNDWVGCRVKIVRLTQMSDVKKK